MLSIDKNYAGEPTRLKNIIATLDCLARQDIPAKVATSRIEVKKAHTMAMIEEGRLPPYAERMENTLPTAKSDPASELRKFVGGKRFATILADPPWRFQNSTGKIAPEHRRLARYGTLSLEEIKELPVTAVAAETAHLYLWIPNALLAEGLSVMAAWGFTYKSNIVWHKIRKDGGPDGRGVGFYFRNVTELVLFGVRGKNARTLAPGRSQVNFIATRVAAFGRDRRVKRALDLPLVQSCRFPTAIIPQSSSDELVSECRSTRITGRSNSASHL